MNIWDTPAGNSQSIPIDYKNADAVIMVYSIDKDSSFDFMSDLYDEAKKHAP